MGKHVKTLTIVIHVELDDGEENNVVSSSFIRQKYHEHIFRF